MKKQLLILSFLTGIGSAYSQNVNIPDANFKAYLVGNPSINTNADTEIQVSEANAFNGTLACNGLNIADLTGIEAFTGTIYLDCSGNTLTTLDLSANTGLSNILRIDYNQLTSVTFPPTSNVTLVHIGNNPFTSIDISSLQSMTNLYANNAYNLSSLDISNNPNLTTLSIASTGLTSIDFTGLSNIESVVAIGSNIVGEIDLSPCSSLVYFNCQNSANITQVNMQNGNNMNVPPDWFVATNCPNLTCVQVDNVSFANAVWTSAVDPGVTFSLDCSSFVPLATSLTLEGQGGVSTITTPGGTLQMVPTILPVEAQGQTVFWGISVGNSLATVDANGLLTAIDNGIVTVGAQTSDGSNVYGTADITISNQVAGLETLVDSKFTVYPNPAVTDIMIQTSDEIEIIKIYSSQGNLVQSEREKVFSVTQLDQGIYTIVLQTTNAISTTRFVKM